MAKPAQPCQCSPYQSICCCGPLNGISVVQPSCQNLPDGSVVNNPAFVPGLNKSFWTYKFITDCGQGTRAISNFGIPICEVLMAEHVTVSEKIDGCGQFLSVPFSLTVDDPNLGPAPDGFQWLKVETQERYEKGISVEYRIELLGDYPVAVQPIKVKAGSNINTFSCSNCYEVPDCNPQGKLSVTKECGHTIIDNQAVLNYNVAVTNTGNASLDNVQFQDTVYVPVQLSLGAITVTPATLTVNTGTPGQITISGNLGTILPGETVHVLYQIPIATVTIPGKYKINNTASAAAEGTKDSASCSTNLDVVQLSADKCCLIEGNKGVYTLTLSSVGLSPDVTVHMFDRMEVPAGVVVKFLDLSGCEGYFSGTTNPVPTNTNIPGPASFDFICKNAVVPAGGSYKKLGTFILVSSSVVGTTTIMNTITDVVPVDPAAQVFLGVSGIPAVAPVDVQLNMVCGKPC
ncbi:MAG: hypothetical protein QHH10_09440 [Peptococcaceae bacterium]|jgi:uncharacterized repeat protein (TIGR01451 family)|nr:DUF11 domain-containing protein [Peptococcaceae bacterium]MDH7525521.1 hypothetical protein [Peptococcaceae bacterium]